MPCESAGGPGPGSRSRWFANTTLERRQLLGALREGRSVELHLRSTQRARQQLRLWLADEATAAELVRALPTEYTVESDVLTPRPAATSQRGLVPVPLVLLAMLASGFVGYALHDLRRPQSLLPVAPQDARDARPMTAGYAAADRGERAFTPEQRAALQAYDDARDPLNERFRSAWYDLQTGALAREEFVRLLDTSLIFDWKVLASEFQRRGRNAPAELAATSARLERACLQHAAGLGLYLYGLQAGDPALVERSIAIMVEADRDVESLQRRAP
ncbi:MAG: hypothetical protein U1F11_07760 [Steroidobacteraceae bacterium]